MNLKELTVTLKGPIWNIKDFEIEGVNVKDKMKVANDGNSAAVKVNDLPVSDDNVLNVFINLGAPNGCRYEVVGAGKTNDNPSRNIAFSESDLVVKRLGKLIIVIDKEILNLLS